MEDKYRKIIQYLSSIEKFKDKFDIHENDEDVEIYFYDDNIEINMTDSEDTVTLRFKNQFNDFYQGDDLWWSRTNKMQQKFHIITAQLLKETLMDVKIESDFENSWPHYSNILACKILMYDFDKIKNFIEVIQKCQSQYLALYGIDTEYGELDDSELDRLFKEGSINFTHEMDSYNEFKEEILRSEKEIVGEILNEKGFIEFNNVLDLFKIKIVDAFIDKSNKMIFGFADTFPQFDKFDINIDRQKLFEKIEKVHDGVNYFFIKANKDIVTINKKYISILKKVFHITEYSNKVDFLIDVSHSYIYIKHDRFWTIIKTDYFDVHQANSEYNSLKILIETFKEFAPSESKLSIFNWNNVTNDLFEKLCKDILSKKGFNNVRIRGALNTPDGGVDIEAEEAYTTLIGYEKRKWIFQCKNSKKGLSRKDVSEVPNLLSEFNADCYGLFCSGNISPQVIDRLKHIETKEKCLIRYWSINDIEAELEQFPDIGEKYNIKVF